MICHTKEELAKLWDWLQQQKRVAYDTETTGLNVRKDKVIGFAIGNETESFYVPLFYWGNTELRPTFGPNSTEDLLARAVLQKLKSMELIMWNGAFDVLMTKNSCGVDLLPALHADALLLKHSVDEEYPFGLKEVAAKIFGKEVTNEKEELKASIKKNGGTAHQYFKADLSVLGKYACQDVMLTMRLFNHYHRELQVQGLEDFYFKDEVLPLYKTVTIPMVERGVRVDRSLLEAARLDIQSDLEHLQNDIQQAIKPHLGVFKTWFLNKDYPLKTPGGGVPKWAKEGFSQEQAFYRDNDEPMFNLSSKHHLKKLFFYILGETPLSRTPTGTPQVDDDFIQSVSGKYDWCKLLTDYNKLGKIKGTYIDRLLEGAEGDRFYPEWKQHGTVSGRYSGDMQQLPRPLESGQASELVIKHNNRIRQFIIADEGSELCSADYEQLEPSIFSHCSGDKKLQAIFNSGADFYSTVAIDTEGLSQYSADKKAPNYLAKVNKPARQKAKAYALGIAYGMTDYKLQFEIGVPQDEAKTLVDKYLSAYPDLHTWMLTSKAQAITHGFVETQAGRRRHLKLAGILHSKYGPGLENSLELWKRYNGVPALYEQAKKDRKTYVNLLNNAINFQVQGLAASIVNRAAIKLTSTLKDAGLKSYIAGQIHDEILLNVPTNEKAAVSDLVQTIMQNITKLDVPLRTVPQFGSNFKECK